MHKYHITPKGNAGLCKAKRKCPYGDMEKDHYNTPGLARQAYEHRMEVVTKYQSNYGFFNEGLREGKELTQIEGAKVLDDYVRSQPKATHENLYRGIDRFGGPWAEKLVPGDILTELAFSSTSSSPDVAAWFATGEDDSCGTVVKIVNSNTLPALELPSYGAEQMQMFGLESEDEYLLPTGLDFKVKAVGKYEWDGESYRMVEVEAFSY